MTPVRGWSAAAAWAASVWLASGVAAQTPRVAIFEGATLITGDASAPIQRSAFVVENDTITSVGRQGEVTAPAGAARVDLAGRFVMPALVDVHTHLGFRRGATFSINNFTRDNILDQLRRFAALGVAAVGSAGTDRGSMIFTIRDRAIVNGAAVRTAGRGIAPPDAGPAPPMREVPYGVSTEDEGRQAVRELAAQHVDFVKIWVDDRNGTVKKLSPAIYRAIIDEAHKGKLRVFAHIAALADAKELLRAGIDGFMHPVRDREVDDELLRMLKERPQVFFALTLFAPRLNASERPPLWLAESLRTRLTSTEEVARLRDLVTSHKPEALAPALAEWNRIAANVRKLQAAGVKLALGTDVGGASAGGLFGWAEHVELENMVLAGLTPAQAIVAGTSTAAAMLGLDKFGSIAAGKGAHFIVLDRNPLDDITRTRRIVDVYLRGKVVPRPSRGRASQ
jgi:imidazolonepropionase-like amidohydrolase